MVAPVHNSKLTTITQTFALLVTFQQVKWVNKFGNRGNGCVIDKITAVFEAEAAKGRIDLFRMR